jgi:hypothetical protein
VLLGVEVLEEWNGVLVEVLLSGVGPGVQAESKRLNPTRMTTGAA